MSTIYDHWIDICFRIVSTVNQSDTMEWCYFLGCTMVAFCAPLAILVFIILPKPQLIVLTFSRYSLLFSLSISRTSLHTQHPLLIFPNESDQLHLLSAGHHDQHCHLDIIQIPPVFVNNLYYGFGAGHRVSASSLF